MESPPVNPTARPGGWFLEFVRAFACIWVLQGLVSAALDLYPLQIVAHLILTWAAFRLLRPTPGWLLGLYCFTLLGSLFTWTMTFEYRDNAAMSTRAEYHTILTFYAWLIFLAVALIRWILGEGAQQQRRLRSAIGYLVPPLEERPSASEGEDTWLRPAEQPKDEILLRAGSGPGDGNPSLLLHLPEEADHARPAEPVLVAQAAVPRVVVEERDYQRLAVQATTLASLLLISWWFVYRTVIEIPQDALFRDARTGDVAELRRRIENGANVNARRDNGKTLLSAAVQGGSPEAVRYLLEAGADVHRADTAGWTPLIYAAVESRKTIARLLASHGASIEQRDRLGNTPLIYAARPHGLGVVAALLELGADVNAVNLNGADALMSAATLDSPVILRLLLRRGADPRRVAKDKTTALLQAAVYCPESFSTLVGSGADINAQDIGGRTALMHLAQWGDPRVVEALVRRGARLSARDETGETALHYAAMSESGHSIPILLRAGAEINAASFDGGTPLMRAAGCYDDVRLESVKALLRGHPDLEASNNRGETALLMAVESRSLKAAGELLKAGANADTRDSSGRSLLDVASDEEMRIRVKELLSAHQLRARKEKQLLTPTTTAGG